MTEKNEIVDIEISPIAVSKALADLLQNLTNAAPEQPEFPDQQQGPVPMKFYLSQGDGKLAKMPNDQKMRTNGMILLSEAAPDGIWVEPVAPDKEKLNGYEAVVRVILVESMSIYGLDRSDGNALSDGYRSAWQAPKRINGQLVNSKDPEDFIACKSHNGIYPEPRYIGRELELFKRNQTIRIGFKEDNGQLLPVQDTVIVDGQEYPDICGNCPASLFRTGPDGKAFRYCDPQTSYILYVLPFTRGDGYEFSGALVEVFTSNKSLETSFRGTSSYGKLADGRTLKGIRHFYEVASDTKTIAKRVEDLKPVHYNSIVAFFKTEDLTQDMVLRTDACDAQERTLLEAIESGDYKMAALNIQVFPCFPEGRPEFRGRQTIVHPLWLETAENTLAKSDDGEGKQSVVFHQGDALDEAEFAEYIRVIGEYFAFQPSHRQFRMGFGTSEEIMALFEQAYAQANEAMTVSYPSAGPRRVATKAAEAEELDV